MHESVKQARKLTGSSVELLNGVPDYEHFDGLRAGQKRAVVYLGFKNIIAYECSR